MTDLPASGETGASAEVVEDAPGGDTTIRRPRVPAPPEPVTIADTDHADDTVIVRRGSRRRGSSGSVPKSQDLDETVAIPAYHSRVAAPVRASRKGRSQEATTDRSEVGERRTIDPIPDASGIRRSLRARARRRLAALVATIGGLVIVLLAALAALVFAPGV